MVSEGKVLRGVQVSEVSSAYTSLALWCYATIPSLVM